MSQPMSDELEISKPQEVLQLSTFAECIAVIRREEQNREELADKQWRSYLTESMALLRIKEECWYLEHECASFSEFCKKFFGWERTYARDMLRGAEVVRNITPTAMAVSVLGPMPLPEDERQVRPLTRLLAAQDQKDAWNLAVERAAPNQPTYRDVDDVVRTEFEGLPTKAQAAAERRAREAEEREREVQERAEKLAREKREAEERAREADRDRRIAEERAEQLLRERDEIQMNRYMRFRKLIDAVRNVAEFHFESAAEIWDGIANARGSDDFMEYLDNAQRCLTRLKLEHPNAVRKPGIVVQRPS